MIPLSIKNITKTCPCSMKQFLKVEKMIFKNVTFFLISYIAQNIDCGYSLEPPR